MALVGLLAALSLGVAACDGKSSTTTTAAATTSTPPSESVLPVAKRGVVTIPMAVVGDPGT